MPKAFEIAGLRAMPGTKVSGWLEVGKGAGGAPVGIPLVILHGKKEGKVVVVDAATHGDETEGPLALVSVVRELDPQSMAGTLIAVPALNFQAFEYAARGNPFEIHHYDLNRLYPGETGGSITQRIAAAYLENVVKRAVAVLTLHGGGTPFYLDGFVIAQGVGGDSLELVRAMGWKRFTDSPDIAVNPYQGTLTSFCRQLGIASITVEMGGVSHRAPKQLYRTKNEMVRGIRNVMIHYGLLDGKPDRPETLQRIRKQNLRSKNGGLIELEPGIDIDAPVKEGQLMMRIYDIFGNLTEEHKAPFSGLVMGLPGSAQAFPGRIIGSVYQVVEEIPTRV
ncbi:MAG: hypothetical protein C4551_07225 [Bacillota bacterium]|nr:MAG: hypothetical protein C4551_07225 [Bacillota bacterium]